MAGKNNVRLVRKDHKTGDRRDWVQYSGELSNDIAEIDCSNPDMYS